MPSRLEQRLRGLETRVPRVVPARIRQWLGEPVSAAEIARDDRDAATSPMRTGSAEIPPHLQQWLDERTRL